MLILLAAQQPPAPSGNQWWWAVPAGVVIGAVLTGILNFFNESRKAKREAKRERLKRLQEVCSDFAASANSLASGTDNKSTDDITAKYILTQMTCPPAVADACQNLYQAAVEVEMGMTDDEDANAEIMDRRIVTELLLVNAMRKEAGLAARPDYPWMSQAGGHSG